MQAEGLKMWARLCNHIFTAEDADEYRELISKIRGITLVEHNWLLALHLLPQIDYLLRQQYFKIKENEHIMKIKDVQINYLRARLREYEQKAQGVV